MSSITGVRKVAAVQMQVRVGDFDWNLARTEEYLQTLREWEPDLVVFPESVLDGYACREPALPTYARTTDSQEVQLVCSWAQAANTWVLWSFPEKAADGIYNTAILIDREGCIRLTYRKVHLCAEVGEGDAYIPGSDFPVIEMEGLPVGVMTCFDRHFPEAARTLALKGAQLILHPTATIWFDPDPASLNTAMMRTRAYENRCFVLSVNQVNYRGGSALFGPWGNVLAVAGRDPEVLKLQLEPALRDRRPENTFRLLPVRRPAAYS